MAAPNRAGVLHWTVAVPVAAALLLALTWGRDLPPAVVAVVAAFLGGAVLAAVHHAEAGDPRTGRYADATLRPWFVVFDGNAPTYAGGTIDTGWYARNNYLLVMTDAHAVPPAISPTEPAESEALERVRQLAGTHASVVSSDWHTLPTVLGTVLPRG